MYLSPSHLFCHSEHAIFHLVDSTFPLKCIFNAFTINDNKVYLVWFWSPIISLDNSNLFVFRRLWNILHYKIIIVL